MLKENTTTSIEITTFIPEIYSTLYSLNSLTATQTNSLSQHFGSLAKYKVT